MAVKRRRCDVVKKPVDPPEKECCPICTLPMEVKRLKQKGCTFFARCHELKMDDNPRVSAQKRSAMFRQYHADICETCKWPKEVCREKRIQKVLRQAKKMGRYLEPEMVTQEVNATECKPPDRRKYTPKTPEWYRA